MHIPEVQKRYLYFFSIDFNKVFVLDMENLFFNLRTHFEILLCDYLGSDSALAI